MLKNHIELVATLEMVLARVKSDPKSVDEWVTITTAMQQAHDYAITVQRMREHLVKMMNEKGETSA